MRVSNKLGHSQEGFRRPAGACGRARHTRLAVDRSGDGLHSQDFPRSSLMFSPGLYSEINDFPIHEGSRTLQAVTGETLSIGADTIARVVLRLESNPPATPRTPPGRTQDAKTMRLRSASAWLLMILLGLLGILPDEADQRILTIEWPASTADRCDGSGEPQLASEDATRAEMPAATPTRNRGGSRVVLSARSVGILPSNTRASLAPSASSFDPTPSFQAPLRL